MLKRNAIRTASGPPAAPEAEIDAAGVGRADQTGIDLFREIPRVIQLLTRLSGRSCQGARLVTEGGKRLATGRAPSVMFGFLFANRPRQTPRTARSTSRT